MQKLKAFVIESYDEMNKKVSRPKFRDLQNSSVLVLVASLIFALMIGMIDWVFDNSVDWFYTQF